MEESLTIEEIDDILDEIEQREPKHLLFDIYENTIDFSNVISLDVELELPQNDDNQQQELQNDFDDFDYLIFDQKSLINGYFIVNLLKQYESAPNEIMNNIIHLCILFTFYDDRDDEEDELIIMSDEETSASSLDIILCGQAQSPINLMTSHESQCTESQQCVSKPLSDNEFIYNPLKFNYPSFIKDCQIINNGHTVQINMPINDKCNLFINNRYYTLKQFHFHIPSEHTINNKQYEMEMHLVHVNHKENKIAVLGFLFSTNNDITKYIKKPSLQLTKSRMHLILPKKEEQEQEQEEKSMILDSKEYNKMKIMKEYVVDVDDFHDDFDDDFDEEEEEKNTENVKDDMKSNDFLDQFFDKLPTEKTEDGDEILLNDLTFDYLFETSSNNFIKNVETNEIDIDMEIFEYMGSLTTPPYTEGVQWLVSKKIHFMNKLQLKKLSKCWQNKNNARDVQQYFGRTVSLRSKSSLRIL